MPYNGTGVDEATGVDYYTEGYLVKGVPLMALYQRCVHLGCRVPYCGSSQWFECPCHGSKYNKAGEYQLGPAPTGMQRFPITVEARASPGRHLGAQPGPAPGHGDHQGAPPGPLLRGRMTGMVALTSAQLLAFVLIGVAFVLAAGFIAYQSKGHVKPRGAPDIPPVMQPAPSDADLEKSRLEKLQGYGVAFVVLFAVLLPLVWLKEPANNQARRTPCSRSPSNAARSPCSCSPRRTSSASGACGATATTRCSAAA